MKAVADRAGCFPDACRHLYVAGGTALRACTDLHCHAFPDAIMTVSRSDERVGDFMQDCVHDIGPCVANHEMSRQADFFPLIATLACSASGMIEDDGPVVKLMMIQQSPCFGFGFGKLPCAGPLCVCLGGVHGDTSVSRGF